MSTPGADDFYGRGLAVPFGWTDAGTAVVAGRAKVEQSIRTILGTAPGERLMRPDFGCGLATLAFAPANEATANLAAYYVGVGLRTWEPRIDVIDVTVTPRSDVAELHIMISYRLRASADVHQLVYPYSLEQS